MNVRSLFQHPIGYMATAFIIISFISCGDGLSQKDKAFLKEMARTQNAERKIVIPKIRDTSSVYGHIRHELPVIYYPLRGCTFKIVADTTRLCIKGDSCWLEYATNIIANIIQKDGSVKVREAQFLETTDPVFFKK